MCVFLFFLFFMVIEINIKSKVVLLLGKSKEKVSLFLEPRKIFNTLLTSYLE